MRFLSIVLAAVVAAAPAWSITMQATATGFVVSTNLGELAWPSPVKPGDKFELEFIYDTDTATSFGSSGAVYHTVAEGYSYSRPNPISAKLAFNDDDLRSLTGARNSGQITLHSPPTVGEFRAGGFQATFGYQNYTGFPDDVFVSFEVTDVNNLLPTSLDTPFSIVGNFRGGFNSARINPDGNAWLFYQGASFQTERVTVERLVTPPPPPPTPSPVPLPASLPLAIAALGGLGVLRLRRNAA